MNEILSKCIEELTKEPPSIDSVRGMLETLLSMNLPAVSHAKPEAVPVALMSTEERIIQYTKIALIIIAIAVFLWRFS